MHLIEGRRLLSFECETHGRLWTATVLCQHDIDQQIQKVVEAHRASYGQDCNAAITAQLHDADSGEPIPGTEITTRRL